MFPIVTTRIYELGDWDHLTNSILAGIETGADRDQLRKTLGQLRKRLGKDFLRKALESGHPIATTIVNEAPWTRQWFRWLAESLEGLKSAENFPTLVGLIKSRERFSEGISTLEIGVDFHSSGFEVIVAPRLAETGKIPDLGLRNRLTGEELFVEISALNESLTQKIASDSYDRVMAIVWPWFPCVCGRIKGPLTGDDLVVVEAEVKNLAAKARREDRFCYLEIRDKIVLGIAPESDVEALRRWGNTHGLEMGQSIGPYFTTDEVVRLSALEKVSKLEEEQKQLPKDRPNIIVITADRSPLFYLHHPDQIFVSLREAILQYPHIFAVVVSARCGAGRSDRRITDVGGDLHICTVQYGAIEKQLFVVFNTTGNLQVSEDTAERIRRSFERSVTGGK